MSDARIFISSNILPVSTPHDIQVVVDLVRNGFASRGWRIDPQGSVSMIGGELYINVIGSTSDNLNTVASVAKSHLQALGLTGIANVQAIFNAHGSTPTTTPTVTPTIQIPSNFVTWNVKVNLSVNTGWLFADPVTSIRNALVAANFLVGNVASDSFWFSTYDISVIAAPIYTAPQIEASMRAALEPIGTVNSLTIASTIGGTIPVPTNNPNLPADDSGDQDLDYYLKKFGENLGFSAGGALVGGLVVGGIILFVIMKK